MIVGVPTSIAAFVGKVPRGPVDIYKTVFNIAEFTQIYGGPDASHPLTHAVRDYFLNGGGSAVILPVALGAAKAAPASLGLTAINEGVWGDKIEAVVDRNQIALSEYKALGFTSSDNTLFNLKLTDKVSGRVETYSRVHIAADVDTTQQAYKNRRLDRVLNGKSLLAKMTFAALAVPVDGTFSFTGGNDGSAVSSTGIRSAGQRARHYRAVFGRERDWEDNGC